MRVVMKRFGFLRNKYFYIGVLAVAIGSLAAILLTSSAKADSGYQRGLQHLFPYYIGDGGDTLIELDNSYLAPLNGDNNAEKVKNFATERLNLNELGGIIFGSALYHVSGLDPSLNDDNVCGIAAWGCDSERWRRLLNFSEIYGLDHLELKSQLIL